MKVTRNGSIEFSRSGIIYRFEKKNFEKHIVRRPKIGHERFLQEIELTILEPHCITGGPKPRSKRNFYRVTAYRDMHDYRLVTYWKIPTFYRNPKLRIIATCIDASGPNYYAINDLEKILWTSPDSQI